MKKISLFSIVFILMGLILLWATTEIDKKQWLIDNNNWFPAVISVSALLISILALTLPIIRRPQHKKQKIGIDVWKNLATFVREVDSLDNPKDIGTVVYMGLGAQNDNSYDITVTKCRFKIPWRRKAKTTELIPYESKFFWRPPEREVREMTTGAGHLSVLYQDIAGGQHTEAQTIHFRVPTVIDETTRAIECKLKIWVRGKPDKLIRRKRFSKNVTAKEGR